MANAMPSISETAFHCPYCGAFAKQDWFSVTPHPVKTTSRTPYLFRSQGVQLSADHQRAAGGRPFIAVTSHQYSTTSTVTNLHVARCANCDELSVWVYDRLVCPEAVVVQPANKDMPSHIQADYDEAASILSASPRGAAALLRLAIQKLCIHLGKPGKNINDDIAALVRDGLNPKIQQSLDYVRVIGNSAVHPGHIDLNDQRDTALTLFKVVNLIVEKLISEPKEIDDLYGSLPQGTREAIEKRDAPKT